MPPPPPSSIPPNPRTQAAAKTRAALLDAAEQLFAESGFHAVGIREISSQAGTNVAAISYHFGSKHDLYVAVMRRAFDERETLDAWRMLDPVPDDEQTAATLLVQFTRRFTERVMTGKRAQRLCRLLVRESWRPSDALGDISDKFFGPYERSIRAAITPLAPELDEPALRRHVRSLFGQLLFPSLFRPFLEATEGVDLENLDVLRHHADHVASVTLHGLHVDPSLIARALRDADS